MMTRKTAGNIATIETSAAGEDITTQRTADIRRSATAAATAAKTISAAVDRDMATALRTMNRITRSVRPGAIAPEIRITKHPTSATTPRVAELALAAMLTASATVATGSPRQTVADTKIRNTTAALTNSGI
jgi:hypothetical protein